MMDLKVKKKALLCCLLALVLALAALAGACGTGGEDGGAAQGNVPGGVAPGKNQSGSVGNLYLDFATDETLAGVSDYTEIDASSDEYGQRLLLTTDGTLNNFSIVRLTWDETSETMLPLAEGEDGELYYAAQMTVDTPLVVSVSFPGVFPTTGVSYTDNNGVQQLYYISMSGEDGSVFLQLGE